MTFATAHMIALTDNTTVGRHNDCAHHRIRLGVLTTIGSQLQATSHIPLVYFLLTHTFAKVRINEHKSKGKRVFLLFVEWKYLR
jgi:hypothetical protein